MQLGFLGLDAEMLTLARAAARCGHRLAAAFDVPEERARDWAAIAPTAQAADSWDALLGNQQIDAFVVSRGANDDVRGDQLRTLVQTGVPMLVAHPVHDSMLVYYELDMNRQESDPVIVPYVPQVWHPAIERLSRWVADLAATHGHIEQVVIERGLTDRSRRSVLAHFVRDVEFVRKLAGEMTRIGAMASRGEEIDYANLSVQMSGSSNVLARWSVVPAGRDEGAKLTLLAGREQAVLQIFESDRPWQLEISQHGESSQETFPDWDAPRTVLARFEQAVAGASEPPGWSEASRDMELADAIERSVRKGRTVDLYFEDHTEHGTFKGMMAAGGCLVLLGALALVIFATTAVNLQVPLAHFWPYLLVAVLGAFLLLQLLKLAFPGERTDR
jgi:myo-inositol 2-dehydrogenase/D-chiro-inositol 1-dehydrogenase